MVDINEEDLNKLGNYRLPLFIGKDDTQEPVVIDLADAPHLLVAGSSSTNINSVLHGIICGLLLHVPPADLRLILVESKGSGLSLCENLPHVMGRPICDPDTAVTVFRWACDEMDKRCDRFFEIGVTDLIEYDDLCREQNEKQTQREKSGAKSHPLPRIVIVVEELGELMRANRAHLEESIIRLSQKAQAAGIHVVCVTQDPSPDVITGVIKANVPVRMALPVDTKISSRVVLDQNGAERLSDRGDALIVEPESPQPRRIQNVGMRTEELSKVIDSISEQPQPESRPTLCQVI